MNQADGSLLSWSLQSSEGYRQESSNLKQAKKQLNIAMCTQGQKKKCGRFKLIVKIIKMGTAASISRKGDSQHKGSQDVGKSRGGSHRLWQAIQLIPHKTTKFPFFLKIFIFLIHG